MAPALDITLVGQEMAACAALGAALGGARALFPEKGRAAFLPDVLLVGALLLGLQSYAAALSAGGVLRWYQLAAAVLDRCRLSWALCGSGGAQAAARADAVCPEDAVGTGAFACCPVGGWARGTEKPRP